MSRTNVSEEPFVGPLTGESDETSLRDGAAAASPSTTPRPRQGAWDADPIASIERCNDC
jgi:hypothetical protein